MTDEDAAAEQRSGAKVFTDKQRDYLRDNIDVSDNYASTLDTRIHQRVTGSLEDIQLFKKLNKQQRESVFQSNKQPDREGQTEYDHSRDEWINLPTTELFWNEGPIGLTWAFMSFFEFYHKTIRENGYSLEKQRKTVQYALEKAEQKVQNEMNEGRYEVNATVEIDEDKDIERVDTDERLEDAMERFEEAGSSDVTGEELKALAEADYITLKGNWE